MSDDLIELAAFGNYAKTRRVPRGLPDTVGPS
jgi:hypothetical protein